MVTQNDLADMSDGQLDDLTKTIKTVLGERAATRKSEAIEQARSVLAQAGLTLKDAVKVTGKRQESRTRPERGKVYTNPEDSSQTWAVGRGRPPKWVANMLERS